MEVRPSQQRRCEVPDVDRQEGICERERDLFNGGARRTGAGTNAPFALRKAEQGCGAVRRVDTIWTRSRFQLGFKLSWSRVGTEIIPVSRLELRRRFTDHRSSITSEIRDRRSHLQGPGPDFWYTDLRTGGRRIVPGCDRVLDLLSEAQGTETQRGGLGGWEKDVLDISGVWQEGRRRR
ncbi:hypothetical protein OF83DRAFT_1086007 [Amylostereum chailletii]|nr:hypothetical protein OF83DRAFT_1086007 [Amylostereum chailletii]